MKNTWENCRIFERGNDENYLFSSAWVEGRYYRFELTYNRDSCCTEFKAFRLDPHEPLFASQNVAWEAVIFFRSISEEQFRLLVKRFAEIRESYIEKLLVVAEREAARVREAG